MNQFRPFCVSLLEIMNSLDLPRMIVYLVHDGKIFYMLLMLKIKIMYCHHEH